MPYNMTCRLHSIIPNFRRIIRQNQCLYHPKEKIPSREFSSDLPSKYHEDKYNELRNRLAEIPYLNLLDKEADRVLQDLCYENDVGLEDVQKWCSKVFNYNVRNGEMFCSTTFLKTYCTYGFNMDDLSWKQWNSDGWKSASIVAWCLELIAAYVCMTDDIIDNSILRNGKPCWYKKPDVGLNAVNDSLLLLFGMYKLLHKHFVSSKCYTSLLHEFLKATHETAYGQCMNWKLNSKNRKQGFDKLTFESYQTLSYYKSSSFITSLPVLLGMHLAGGCTAEDYDFAKKLCLKLGLYFQSQDDYSDCFGNNELKLNGMIGNDIRDGNCTWLSVKFFEVASEPMKKQFLENYGIDDKDAIANVLELYRKANLSERFEEFDEQLYTEISNLIESMKDVKGYLFYDLFTDRQKRER